MDTEKEAYLFYLDRIRKIENLKTEVNWLESQTSQDDYLQAEQVIKRKHWMDKGMALRKEYQNYIEMFMYDYSLKELKRELRKGWAKIMFPQPISDKLETFLSSDQEFMCEWDWWGFVS